MHSIIKSKMTLEEKFVFIAGIISTMPILQIRGTSVFTFFALLMTVYFALKIYIEKKNPFKDIANTWYAVIVLTGIVSALICLTSDMQSYWKTNQYTNIMWLIMFLVILVYFNRKEGVRSAQAFLNGVYCAAIFQTVWAILQYVIFKLTDISINTVFFTEVLNMVEHATHWKYNESIALSGFCWHVGNMTPLVTFGYVFTRNKLVKVLFLVYAIICNSRTTLLGMLLCVFLELVYYFKNWKNVYKKITVGVGVGIVLLGCITFQDLIIQIIQKVAEVLTEGSVDSSALTHLNYWTSLPFFFENLDIKNLLFGFGLENSGYPFSKHFLQYVGEVWVVECDYINQLWNTGIVGFMLVYGWIANAYRTCRKSSYKYSLFIVALLFEGVTYNVIFKWCWVVLFALYSVGKYQGMENE